MKTSLRILPLAILVAVIVSFYYCKSNIGKNEFAVKVAGKEFIYTNQDLPDLPESRSPADVKEAAGYLVNVAVAANITAELAHVVSDKKKTVQALWALMPLLIENLPTLIKAGKSLKKFQEFYNSVGGLTPDEMAVVNMVFAEKLALPYPTAEKIAEATVQAAVANMKLAIEIQGVVKK